jgi:hypothetical protein
MTRETGWPKIELHVHLEGTVDAPTLLRLAKRNGVGLPSQSRRHGGAEVAHPAALTAGSRAPSAGGSRCPAGSGPDRGLRSRAHEPAPPRTRVGETARRATGRRRSPHRHETAPLGLRRSSPLFALERARTRESASCSNFLHLVYKAGAQHKETRRARPNARGRVGAWGCTNSVEGVIGARRSWAGSTGSVGAPFDAIFRSEGLEIVRTPIQAPNANAYAERWVGSARGECLDRLLIFGRRQLEHVLRVYIRHFNQQTSSPSARPATAGSRQRNRSLAHSDR